MCGAVIRASLFDANKIGSAWGGGIFDIDVSTWEVAIDEGDQIQ